MARSVEKQPVEAVASGGVPPAAARSLVLVAGSGRSGTSLFTGILQRLGFHVPQPEVPADETNPRGFAESRWVVDFHTQLLRKAGVQMGDARPRAWAMTADVGFDEEIEGRLRAWLDTQFGEADDIVIKDPRLAWFLPLWQRCAERLDVSPRIVTVLRHPAAVIDSKLKWYGGWQGGVDRAAGWLNLTLFTERATRDARRMFVRYDDVLDDWPQTIAHVAEVLGLPIVLDAELSSMRAAHEFVDRTLSRSQATWDDFKVPEALRTQADEVWELVSKLADEEGRADPAVTDSLDAAREAYVSLYEDAEAIAQSSIAAARRVGRAPRKGRPPRLLRAGRRIPKSIRRMVPLRWRKTLVSGADSSSGARQR